MGECPYKNQTNPKRQCSTLECRINIDMVEFCIKCSNMVGDSIIVIGVAPKPDTLPGAFTAQNHRLAVLMHTLKHADYSAAA